MIRRREQLRIDVIDTKKNTAVGIGYPFGTKPLMKLNYTTKDQVKSNLICFMLTNTGERPFNPTFGADLRRFVFEQMTSTDELREIILSKLGQNFPQINVTELDFDIINDENKIIISLSYTINRQEDSLTIQLA